MLIGEMLNRIGKRSRIHRFKFATYEHRQDSDDPKAPPAKVHTFYQCTRTECVGIIKDLEKRVADYNAPLTTWDSELYVGITSMVGVGRNQIQRNLPLIDFGCEKSPENKQKIYDLLKGKGILPGYLIDSGRSYHYYGAFTMDDSQWNKFMDECGRSKLVDKHWAEMRSKEGYSLLRVSTGLFKHSVPTIIAKMLRDKAVPVVSQSYLY